jgi:hypothetical protein
MLGFVKKPPPPMTEEPALQASNGDIDKAQNYEAGVRCASHPL